MRNLCLNEHTGTLLSLEELPRSQTPVQRRQYNAGSLQYSLLSNLMFGVQMVSASYDIFFERSRPVRLNYIEAHIHGHQIES